MRRIFFGWLVSMFCAAEMIHAQGTAFTYQGWLNDGGSLANSNYDLAFTLYTSSNLPSGIVAGPVTNSAVPVTNGQFMVTLDFGAGAFTGPDRWLQIAVRATGNTNFIALSPRQKITPTPYAMFANSAGNLVGGLAATQLVGTLPASAFAGYTNTVALTNGANLFSGTFSGNGTNLVNLNAAQLTGGTIADARQSTNVALLNRSQTFSGSNIFTGTNLFTSANTFSGTNLFSGANVFTGTNTFTGVNNFTNRGNNFIGSFFGNGLVGWILVPGASALAMPDAGYLLTNSQLTTVTLPPTAALLVGDIVRISGAGAGGWQVALNPGQSVIGNFSGFARTYWTLSGASAGKWFALASSADGLKLAAALNTGSIFTSTDGGNTWNATSAGSLQWHSLACSADGTKLVGVVNNGNVYTSTNSGSTWAQQSLGLPGTALWTSVASSADGVKLAATIYGGFIYTSTNSGLNWAQQTSGLPGGGALWTSIASSADGTKLVAVATNGAIYLSVNSGLGWSTPGTFASSLTSVASSTDGTKLILAQSPGFIYTSTNSGSATSWVTQSNAPANMAWNAVASSADGTKLAAAVNGGGIYLSSNAGATWQRQTNAPNQNWNAITMSADGTRLAAASYALAGGIYISQAATQTTSMVGTNGYVSGGQGTAVELQYIGNNQFMPVSSVGTIWAY